MSVSHFARTSQVRQNEKRTICLARFDLLRPPDTHTHTQPFLDFRARRGSLDGFIYARGGPRLDCFDIYSRGECGGE